MIGASTECPPSSQNKSGVGPCHDSGVANEEALSSISIEMGCASLEIHLRSKSVEPGEH
jgi:hypothetical protein